MIYLFKVAIFPFSSMMFSFKCRSGIAPKRRSVASRIPTGSREVVNHHSLTMTSAVWCLQQLKPLYEYIINCIIYIWLVVLTILKNMTSSMGRIIPYIMENKKCSKPPPSIYIYGVRYKCYVYIYLFCLLFFVYVIYIVYWILWKSYLIAKLIWISPHVPNIHPQRYPVEVLKKWYRDIPNN
jgi:hypothetical protein